PNLLVLEGLEITSPSLISNLKEEAYWAHLDRQIEPIKTSISAGLSTVASREGMNRERMLRVIRERIQERERSPAPEGIQLAESQGAYHRTLEHLLIELGRQSGSLNPASVRAESLSKILEHEMPAEQARTVADQLEREFQAAYRAREM